MAQWWYLKGAIMSSIAQMFRCPVSTRLVCWTFPLLEDSSPPVSYISIHLVPWLLFVTQLSFQGCLYSELPWRIEIVSPLEPRQGLITALESREYISLWSKGQACLLSTLNNLGSLSSEFLLHNVIYCVCRCHLALFILLCDN